MRPKKKYARNGQATPCAMAFVVAMVTCLGRELLRTVVRTEPEWTFWYQNTSESEVFSLVDVKISSDGKTDWANVNIIYRPCQFDMSPIIVLILHK